MIPVRSIFCTHLRIDQTASQLRSSDLRVALRTPATLASAFLVASTSIVSLRCPLGPWLVVFTLCMGASLAHNIKRISCAWLFLLVGATTTWIVLSSVERESVPWPAISTNADAWSYGAQASYLTNNSRGVDAGMSLLDQYGSHLQNSRFASACALAVTTYWTGSHQFYGHTIFYIVCLLILFFSSAYVALTLGTTRLQGVASAAAVLCFGWISNAIVVGNYDNLVFIAIFPVGIGLAIELFAESISRRTFVVHASVVTAALICTYPEGLVLSVVLISPLVINSFLRFRSIRDKFAPVLLAWIFSLVLASPYIAVLQIFLRQQFMAATPGFGPRPGEGYFGGLLSGNFLPALFSLGSEYPGASNCLIFDVIPVILLACIAWGGWRLRHNAWFPWMALPVTCILLWQCMVQKYSYGAYKTILCSTWWIYPAIVCGFSELFAWVRSRLYGGLAAVSLVALSVTQREIHQPYRIFPPDHNLAGISDLTMIPAITDGRPILVSVDSDFEQLWAISLLKSQPLILSEHRSYLSMPHVKAYLDRARKVPEDPNLFVLSSKSKPSSVWSNNRFSLSIENRPFISGVDSPNGVETLNGLPFIWVAATRPLILSIFAPAGGMFDLSVKEFLLGPGAPNTNIRNIEVTDVSGRHECVVGALTTAIPIQLTSGQNQVQIRSLTPASIHIYPNGDSRELLLGLRGYFLKPR
jgi:hypothetical protein